MRKLIYILFFLSIFPIGKLIAQQDFSIGLGGGPNFYWGSIAKKDYVGYTIQLDSRYNFNNKFSTTLSYSYNQLNGSRHTDAGLTEKYFSTTANNIDLHFGVDLVKIINVLPKNTPFKVVIDLGAGYSFYNEGLYHGEIDPDKEDEPNYNYKSGIHGPGSSAKIHLGGEVLYAISSDLSVFGSILGHYYFTSELDGYAHYYKDLEKPTKNDVFYSTTVGCRYNVSFGSNSKKKNYPRTTNSGNVFQDFRFKPFTGWLSPKKSYKKNKSKEPRAYPGGRS